MFAFRKLQAARYHCARVEALIAIQHQELRELHAGAEPDKVNITSVAMRSSKSANEFAFELSAFFAAIRSAIDFLAKVCAQHVNGVELTSIKALVRLAKGKTDPILDVIAEDAEWIEQRLIEVFREGADVRLSAPLGRAHDTNPARPAFSDEEVAAR
jgi:hypothetical protein